jgi:hypothetical protein
MKRLSRLTLSKETLWQMDTQKGTTIIGGGNDSCVDSCYLVSCGGGCTISTGEKD